MSASDRWVGVDVGGTKILAVLVDDAGDVVSSTTRPMPGRTAPDAEIEAAIVAAVHDVTGGESPAGVGISAAGLVDRAREHYLFGAHLPWRGAPLRERLAEQLAGPRVVIDNDANCAAYAEVVAGAAREVDSAVLITIGTGIGGALVLGGRVLRGAHGLAGEFGHQQVVPDGLPCECGLRGCWEQYCSGRALERVTRVSLGRHLDGPEVAALAHAGDEVALRAFGSVGTWLGVGVAGLVSAFDPAIVIIGGGVSAVGDLLLDPARAALLDSLQGVGHRPVPSIVPTRFGPDAGAVGAALLVRDDGAGGAL